MSGKIGKVERTTNLRGENKVISFRVPKEKFDELSRLVLESGLGAASIARKGLYQELDRMKAERKAAA